MWLDGPAYNVRMEFAWIDHVYHFITAATALYTAKRANVRGVCAGVRDVRWGGVSEDRRAGALTLQRRIRCFSLPAYPVRRRPHTGSMTHLTATAVRTVTRGRSVGAGSTTASLAAGFSR